MQELVCDALLNGKSLSVLVLLFAKFICSIQVKGWLVGSTKKDETVGFSSFDQLCWLQFV